MEEILNELKKLNANFERFLVANQQGASPEIVRLARRTPDQIKAGNKEVRKICKRKKL
jgi:hypothetical protein